MIANLKCKVFQPVKIPKNSTIEEIKPRLKNAVKSLHLPAAYKDVLICYRMIIRIKRKQKIKYQLELKNLYKFACQCNFFYAEPYLEKAKMPSYNLEKIIKGNFFTNLDMPYKIIGFEEIEELNKTDKKLLLAEFGEPDSHCTVAEYHREKRNNLEQLLIKK